MTTAKKLAIIAGIFIILMSIAGAIYFVTTPTLMQPIAQPIAQPATSTITQPIAQPIIQPIAQPVMQPVAQPIMQPVEQPIAQSIEQPIVQPPTQTMQPVAQAPVQPATQVISRPIVSSMKAGDSLKAGEFLTSQNGRYRLMMLQSGELVVQDTSKINTIQWDGIGQNKRVLTQRNNVLMQNGQPVGSVDSYGVVSVVVDGKQRRGFINGNILMLEAPFSQEYGVLSQQELRFVNAQSPVVWTSHTGGMGLNMRLELTATQMSLIDGTAEVWRCLPSVLNKGNVDRLTIQDSGNVLLISEQNVLLWSSATDTPRFISVGHSIQRGTQIRSAHGTSVFKIAENGAYQFICSDVYSDKAFLVASLQFGVQSVYLRPDQHLISDSGILKGRNETPLNEVNSGNYKITVDEGFNLVVIDPRSTVAVMGLWTDANEFERFAHQLTDQVVECNRIVLRSPHVGSTLRYFLHLSCDGKLRQICFRNDQIIGEWESTQTPPAGTTSCTLTRIPIDKVNKFVIGCYASSGAYLGAFDPFPYTTRTSSHRIVLQTDANLVIYDAANKPLWASGVYIPV